MDIKKARELLGKNAEGKSDEEIKKDIEIAQFFVDIFFEMLEEGKIKI